MKTSDPRSCNAFGITNDADLPAPDPLPTGCDANCENASRTYLPVGTEGVGINAGGQTVATGDVIASEYGMVVVVGPNNSSPSFVSLCKAEIITK